MENKHKTFKPYDRVLVRDSYALNTSWHCDYYSDYGYSVADEEYRHYSASGGRYKDSDILPYEGNEHLLGSTDEPEEEIKLEVGEWVMVCNEPQILAERWAIKQFQYITPYDTFKTSSSKTSWAYAIRFCDFNPNNWKETKKHILCVKDGKVVRYKE